MCVVATLLALLCLVACARTSSTTDARTNASRKLEDELKATAIDVPALKETKSIRMVREIQTSTGAEPIASAAAIATTESAGLLILDNNRGAVFAIEPSRTTRASLRRLNLLTRLTYPYAMRTRGGLLYISDDDAIHVFSAGGMPIQRIQSFYTVHDLVPLTTDRIVINPILNEETGPLIVEIDASGRRMNAWGERHAGLGGLKGRAHLAACDGWLIAAMVHEPTVLVFPIGNGSSRRIDVPFPGELELRELAAERHLVSPRPGVVRLPTFLAGVACQNNALFVLLDLPAPVVYEFDLDGHVQAVYRSGTAMVYGRHFWRLSAMMLEDHARMYSIAVETDGARKIIEFVFDRRGTSPTPPPANH